METELYSLFLLTNINNDKVISFLGTFSSELFALDFLKDSVQKRIEDIILECETQISLIKNLAKFDLEISKLALISLKDDLKTIQTLLPTENSLKEFLL